MDFCSIGAIGFSKFVIVQIDRGNWSESRHSSKTYIDYQGEIGRDLLEYHQSMERKQSNNGKMGIQPQPGIDFSDLTLSNN